MTPCLGYSSLYVRDCMQLTHIFNIYKVQISLLGMSSVLQVRRPVSNDFYSINILHDVHCLKTPDVELIL